MPSSFNFTATLKPVERQIRPALLDCFERGDKIVRDARHLEARIELDQVLERCCEQRLVFDDQDIEHWLRPSPDFNPDFLGAAMFIQNGRGSDRSAPQMRRTIRNARRNDMMLIKKDRSRDRCRTTRPLR
jgi:hypothetical protein